MNDEMHGIECLNGTGKVTGRLIGGCIEVVDWLRGTPLWPSPESFDGAILFLETSEEKPEPEYILRMLRIFVAMGIIERINGIIFSKPLDEAHYEAYKDSINTAIVKEAGFIDLPILFNLNFGHASPICVLPYGALAEIDCETKRFTILESAVV
jgi:muramoyltetrapeptide carboxypeptidase LdcA involved in peptidoglycan recycling